MTLPLRYQLAVVLVGLNVVATAALASFAYRTSRQSLEEQARLAVGDVADARQQAVLRLLERGHQRMNAFLSSVQSLCGERAPSGRLGFEPECVRVALSGFRNAERATAAELRYGVRLLASEGSRRNAVMRSGLPTGRPAMVSVDGVRGAYTMRANRGRFTLSAQFLLNDLEMIFGDRSGLRTKGEAFLTDAHGALLTSRRYPIPPGPPALPESLGQCLAGRSGEMFARDYRGVPVFSAYRPMAIIGGGCVVANLQYADALVPIRRLGRTFLYGSTGFILVSIGLSLLIARAVAKPILQREHAARLEAEAANRLKDEFLATLSHELRTPLNAILGWSSILKHERSDRTRTAHAVSAIERSARTQARLVDELLDVSRINSGRMRLNISGVGLTTVVEAALDVVRPAAEAKGLEIATHIDAATRTIAGDAQRLQQVVWNLLANAVRFTPAGGRVEVTLREVDGSAEIQVTDSGIGILPEFVPHVFERFRQGDSGVTRAHGGLGLGLAIARHLVELHGGTIGAESAGEGHGATFTVRLPLRAEVPAVAPPAEVWGPPGPPILLHGIRVLVVDDDLDARDMLKTVLETAGATVATTASASETRDILGRMQPDLLIADIGMREEDGYALIRSVRALGSKIGHVPAIALTSHAHAGDVERALASGFQMHVAKPVDPTHLLMTIARLVHAETEPD